MHLKITRRPAAVSLLLVLALAGLLLAGCGSSSSNTVTTSASATAAGGGTGTGATGTGGTGATGQGGTRATGSTGTTGARGAGRFTAIRECLQKAGITLPSRPQGTPPRGGGGLYGGGSGAGPALPKGVTRAQFQAALKKCGLSRRPGAGGRFGAGRPNLKTPAFLKTLASFSACMNEHGVGYPPPTPAGKAPCSTPPGSTPKARPSRRQRKPAGARCICSSPGPEGPGPPVARRRAGLYLRAKAEHRPRGRRPANEADEAPENARRWCG